jgi:hypothetical protein
MNASPYNFFSESNELRSIKFLTVVLYFLIEVIDPLSAHAASGRCVPVKSGNGIATLGKSNIKMMDGQTMRNWTTDMEIIRSVCEAGCKGQPENRVWRIPSRADMEIVGNCLDPQSSYWTSDKVENSDKVYVYRNGNFSEENPNEVGRFKGIGITGGSPSALSNFAKIADEIIEKSAKSARENPGDLGTLVHKHEVEFGVQRIAEVNAQDALRAQKNAQQAALLGGPPKGTIWNCMSDVVPVNTSINLAVFSCPTVRPVNFVLMQKYKWKITSTERIPAQAENYRSDAYGMTDWNGNGVIISLMLEKQ